MSVPVLLSQPSRKGGRRRPVNKPAIRFGDIMTGAAITPFSVDYLAKLDGGWSMLGNDKAGDCEAVRWANNRRFVTSLLTDTAVYPDQSEVWEIYQTQNPGFVPGTGPHGYGSDDDHGMDSQTLLEYLHKTGGPDGAKIVAFAQVDPGNASHVQYAIDIFGAVWVDIIVLFGNQTEFSEGIPWTNDSSSIDGGHAVLGGGVNTAPTGSNAGVVDIETWAKETALTESFWNGSVSDPQTGEVYRLVEAVWVPIWEENLGTRQFQDGIDADALKAAYQAITGRTLSIPATSAQV